MEARVHLRPIPAPVAWAGHASTLSALQLQFRVYTDATASSTMTRVVVFHMKQSLQCSKALPLEEKKPD
jgi:hypothetical protein